MTEQEMLREIDRLRRELAEVREDRQQLHRFLCQILPLDRTEITAEQSEKIIKNAKSVDDLMRELVPVELHDRVFTQ